MAHRRVTPSTISTPRRASQLQMPLLVPVEVGVVA